MQLRVFGLRTSTLLAMKLLILLTVVACFQVSGRGFGQRITLDLKDVSLEVVFKEIRKQTGYSFVYTREQVERAKLVTIRVRGGELESVLKKCFQNQPLSFIVEGKYIIVQTRKVIVELENGDSTIDIRGRIIDDNNIPVSGITIQVKGTKRISISDANGYFILKEVSTSDVLLVSGAEIEPQEI